MLFWWQAFAILGITVFLWSGLPTGAVFYGTRRFAPLPDARAAYVVLDPSAALRILREARSDWMAGSGGAIATSFAIDLGLAGLRDGLPPPAFLEKGGGPAAEWRPAAVETLPRRVSAVPAPSVSGVCRGPDGSGPPEGVRLLADPGLAKLSFAAEFDAGKVPGEEGHARFYVETGEDGRVAHVLAMTPLANGVAVIERALLRGRADGAGRGFVEVYWRAAR